MDPPAGPGRLIEVIGDSITCGYVAENMLMANQLAAELRARLGW